MQRRILVIEADPEVSALLVQKLPEDDIVEVAPTIADGVARLALGQACADIDAVILDPDLPCCKGLDCYQRLRSAAPLTPIIVMSGNEDADLAQVTAADGVEYVLKDALLPSTLQTMVRTSIDRFHLLRESRELRELRAKG